MASAAEQLAANLNFGAFAKAEDLKRRIWFTLGALLVYRLGTFIPLPGINPAAFAETFKANAGGILGMFNMFAGGAVERMAIFALNIMPYISASIIMQLMTSVDKRLEALKKEGEQGRKQINQYTRYLTVVLAAFQAYGIAIGLEGSRSAAGAVVIDPGWFFRISTVITLVGGTVFLMWLGEQITAARRRQRHLADHLRRHRRRLADGAGRPCSSWPGPARSSTGLLLALLVADAGRGRGIVFIERAQRRLLIQYPEATGRQPHVPGRQLAPAAEAEFRRRHPADLRLLAAAAADHGCPVLGRPGPGMAERDRCRTGPRPAAATF